MAISILSAEPSFSTTNAGTTTVNYPTTVAAGDGLLLMLSDDGAPALTASDFTAEGFTQLGNTDTSESHQSHVWYKTADGTEGGTTFTYSKGTNEKSSGVMLRLDEAVDFSTTAPLISTVDNAFDPASVSGLTSGDSYLAIALLTTNAAQEIATYPSGYDAGTVNQDYGQVQDGGWVSGGGSVGTGQGVGVAFGSLAVTGVTSVDPGAFTTSGSALGDHAFTIVIEEGVAAARTMSAPASATSGSSFAITLTGTWDASGKTVSFNGEDVSASITSQDASSITISSFPALEGMTAFTRYGQSYTLSVDDTTTSPETSSVTASAASSRDFFTVSGVSYASTSLFSVDGDVVDGDEVVGSATVGSISSIGVDGTPVTSSGSGTYEFYYADLSASAWVGPQDYLWSAPGRSISAPSTVASNASLTISLTGTWDSSGKTVSFNGNAITPDSQDASSITISNFPQLYSLTTAGTRYNQSYTLSVDDTNTDPQTDTLTVTPQSGYDFHAITGVPVTSNSIYFDDTDIANGDEHYGVATTGTTNTVGTDGSLIWSTSTGVYEYSVFDISLGAWSNLATESFSVGVALNNLVQSDAQAGGSIDVAVDTDKPSVGTLYVLVSANSSESASTVSSSGASQSVVAGTTQTVNDTPVTPGASLYAHVMQNDGVVDSNVLSSSTPFSVDSAVSVSGSVPSQSDEVDAAISTLAMSSYFTPTTSITGYAVTSGSLPTGVVLNTSTGDITGTPTVGQSATSVQVTATDSGANTAAQTFTWEVIEPSAVISNLVVSDNQAGGSIDISVDTDSVSLGDFHFYVSGNASENAATVETSGTSQSTSGVTTQTVNDFVVSAGSGRFLHVVQTGGPTPSNVLSSTAFNIDAAISADGSTPDQADVEDSAIMTLSMSDYFTPITSVVSYAVTSGALPTGLALNTSTGDITGTPTVVQSATPVTITVTDTGANTASQTFDWTVPSSSTPGSVLSNLVTSDFQIGGSVDVAVDTDTVSSGTLYVLVSSDPMPLASTVMVSGTPSAVSGSTTQTRNDEPVSPGAALYTHAVQRITGVNSNVVSSLSPYTISANASVSALGTLTSDVDSSVTRQLHFRI